ncbi:hypothetical protein ABMX64_20090 [Vibrio vulnificus]|uniref:hypothetical protein n=1 Tax=Vibrio vulnificus TaxID=672 RepID=UPI001A3106B0|nr:hypothetical protein [Vibrio vulnificus]EGQ7854341.1 hypothetical protein [Vibrio vulnificus]EIE1227666.1 hypothetical protein [Vibrio vulnificus]MDK2679247.1 hypothetical protein [Vibrio vulnificus]MDK2688024.1 hypothetical protein [Vibrio vulnificus]
MATKFLVTSAKEAEGHLEGHFRKKPIRAGHCSRTQSQFWYCSGKRCVMRPTGTKTANGTTQYLVTVE